MPAAVSLRNVPSVTEMTDSKSGKTRPTEEDDRAARLGQIALNPHLANERKAVIAHVAQCLEDCGPMLQALGAADGDSSTATSSIYRSRGEETIFAVGILIGIAAELASVSGELLSGTHYYAGAALLRQIVEIEYLTWAFANDERDATLWLNSTREQRTSLFTPARLRKISSGRFNAEDYRNHCELGGHPVPRGVDLIDSSNPALAQMLLVDLLLHCWRITDNLNRWLPASNSAFAEISRLLYSANRAFKVWGNQDPLYSWACAEWPERFTTKPNS